MAFVKPGFHLGPIVREDIIFKNKIGRIRDIQVHPNNGKIYLLAGEGLWLMEKN